MPRLELESSATFLAIKRCQRTKFGKVIKLAQSSIKIWAHICAHHQSLGLISIYFAGENKLTQNVPATTESTNL
jgi:hypothetical protein